jgi:hypothetical protein
VAGKYAGLVLTLLVNVSLMSLALYAVLGYMGWIESPEFKRGWEAPAADPALLIAIGLIFVELMLVTAIALFFSTFSSPMLSSALTFGFYLAGHFSEDLRRLDEITGSTVVSATARALYYVLPNFATFDVKSRVVHAQPPGPAEIGLACAYGVIYVAMLLVAASWIFSRRDLK